MSKEPEKDKKLETEKTPENKKTGKDKIIPGANKKKPSKKKQNRSVDDFIYAWGSPRIVCFYQRITIVILMLVIISMSILLVVLSTKVNEVTPLPIFIDRIAGTARCVEYEVVDAMGKERVPSEIQDFTEQFILDCYTYNKFTIRSNLKKALDHCENLVKIHLKELLKVSERVNEVRGNRQGMVEIESILVMETKPDIRVQVVFTTKVLVQNGDLDLKIDKRAVIRIKTIKRGRHHAHGLYISEYRETNVKIEKN